MSGSEPNPRKGLPSESRRAIPSVSRAISLDAERPRQGHSSVRILARFPDLGAAQSSREEALPPRAAGRAAGNGERRRRIRELAVARAARSHGGFEEARRSRRARQGNSWPFWMVLAGGGLVLLSVTSILLVALEPQTLLSSRKEPRATAPNAAGVQASPALEWNHRAPPQSGGVFSPGGRRSSAAGYRSVAPPNSKLVAAVQPGASAAYPYPRGGGAPATPPSNLSGQSLGPWDADMPACQGSQALMAGQPSWGSPDPNLASHDPLCNPAVYQAARNADLAGGAAPYGITAAWSAYTAPPRSLGGPPEAYIQAGGLQGTISPSRVSGGGPSRAVSNGSSAGFPAPEGNNPVSSPDRFFENSHQPEASGPNYSTDGPDSGARATWSSPRLASVEQYLGARIATGAVDPSPPAAGVSEQVSRETTRRFP